MRKRLFLLFLAVLAVVFTAAAQLRIESKVRIARLKVSGGTDWYNDPSAEVNLLRFSAQTMGIDVEPEYQFLDLSNENLFSYPILFLTGHGNFVLSEYEVQRLRQYLQNGGFLYVDDDYGLDKAFRRELRRVFPDLELVELPFEHPIYNSPYRYPNGPPKTHEHDNKPPQGLALYVKNRMAVYYTFESNPSDGWADPQIHKDPEPVRQEALKFGANILLYALTH